MASLPSHVAGQLLHWGWRCFNGETIFIDEEESHTEDVREILALGVNLLDATALALNIIDVSAFSVARQREQELKLKRIQSKEIAEADQISSSSTNVISIKRFADGTIQRTNRELETGDDPRFLSACENLVDQGIKLERARKIIETCCANHDLDEVLIITQRMMGKTLMDAEKYLVSSLRNLDYQARRISHKRITPKAVRRLTPARRDSVWEFIGWTCKGHPQAGKSAGDRRKAWRTDTGRIVYKLPDEKDVIPSFEEDPGIVEVE